jgi:hypothetical protein
MEDLFYPGNGENSVISPARIFFGRPILRIFRYVNLGLLWRRRPQREKSCMFSCGFCGRNLETCPVTIAPIGDSSLFTLPRPVQSPHLVHASPGPSLHLLTLSSGIGPQSAFVTLLSLPLAPRLSVNYVGSRKRNLIAPALFQSLHNTH